MSWSLSSCKLPHYLSHFLAITSLGLSGTTIKMQGGEGGITKRGSIYQHLRRYIF